MDVTMRMPDLATTGSAVKVVRWLIEVGRPVRRGEPLLEVETDKAVMDVESVVTGTLASVSVQPGDEVAVGQVIARFDAAEGTASAPAPAVEAVTAAARSTQKPTSAAPRREAESSSARVSFFARNRAARRGGQRPVESIPLGVAAKTLARRMRESKQNVPHFYLQVTADAAPMAARRAASGRSLAWDAFFVHAAGKALEQYPRMCYRFEDDRLVAQKADAVNVAVDLDDGLFSVAVERPARRTPEEISDAIRAGVERLKSGDPRARMTPRGDLTVSNLGGTGVDAFAAIINPPESAVLAVGRVRDEAVVVDGRVAVGSRVTLTLSVDHRVVNGKYAAGFLKAIVAELEAL